MANTAFQGSVVSLELEKFRNNTSDGSIAVAVTNPDGTFIGADSLTTTVISGQVKIAVTGTAVQLPSNPGLVSGIVVMSKSTNNAVGGTVGPASITNTVDGTGNGDIVVPGTGRSFAVTNSNAVFVNGTIGDIFSFSGN